MNNCKPSLNEDDVLTALYQGQLDQKPFTRFIKKLEARLGVDSVRLDIGVGKNNRAPVPLVDYKVPEEKALALFKLHQEYWRDYPIKDSLVAGDIYTLQQICSADERKKNRYIQALLTPFHIDNELVMAVSGPDQTPCLLRLGLPRGTAFTDDHITFITQLRPHLEQALQMHLQIHRPSSIVEQLSNTTDAMGTAYLILNAHGEVIQSNALAKMLAERGEYFLLRENKIHFPTRHHYNQYFSDIFQQALQWRDEELYRHPYTQNPAGEIPYHLMLIAGQQGRSADCLIQPLRAYPLYRNETSAHVMVLIVDNQRQMAAPVKLLMQRYQLSSTEALFSLMLANGNSIVHCANQLHLTEGSARTYSKRIYAKMGVHRQAELVQLLLKSVVTLAH